MIWNTRLSLLSIPYYVQSSRSIQCFHSMLFISVLHFLYGLYSSRHTMVEHPMPLGGQ
uniref:Uncharacterized protein n=1 Tax=Arundo donax TaxID=35708 RepID=A0A0A9Q8S7_ARUDO